MAGRVGVLALQGAFREHIAALRDIGVDAVEVRLARDHEGLDGLVIPGGESSTMSKLIEAYDLETPIRELHARGGAFLGTCAGMIVLAHHAEDGRPDQRYLDMIDIDVRRNAYGRQPASFESPLRLVGEDLPIPGVFIRAPQIERRRTRAAFANLTISACNQTSLVAAVMLDRVASDAVPCGAHPRHLEPDRRAPA